jgi:hypothetical protein
MVDEGRKRDIPVEDIGELLDKVSAKLPALVSGIMTSLYSAEAGKRLGQAVGALYKELLASGIPADTAAKMATEYMSNLPEVLGQKGLNIGKGGQGQRGPDTGGDSPEKKQLVVVLPQSSPRGPDTGGDSPEKKGE